MSGNRITVQDIADALGLSRNTVSKAINNSEGIAEETRRRVLSKAVEMGYKQFGYAKGLLSAWDAGSFLSAGSGQTNEISLLTQSVWDSRHFAALMLDAFEREIDALGFVLRSHYVPKSHAEELRLPESFDPNKSAAILCIEVFDYDYAQMVCGLGLPTLFVDSAPRLGNRVLPSDVLLMDNNTPLQTAVSEALATGVRKIGFIGNALHCQSFMERYKTVVSTMSLADQPFDKSYYIGYGYQEEIIPALQYMCDRVDLPELFVCANDFIAIEARHALRYLGIRVPEDVMLMGFDDAPMSRTCVPPLTTVHIHTQVMAFSCVQLIMTRLKEPSLDFRQLYTQTDLIVRASTSRQ